MLLREVPRRLGPPQHTFSGPCTLSLRAAMANEMYVAFNQVRVEAVEESGILTPAQFGDRYNYVPLKITLEAAVAAALVKAPPSAATHHTTWFVLKVMITDNQMAKYRRVGTLFDLGSSPQMWPRRETWRVWGPLPLSDVSYNWTSVTIAPLGKEAWADATLSREYLKKVAGNSMCMGCGATDVIIWAADQFFNLMDYCLECWYKFLAAQEEV